MGLDFSHCDAHWAYSGFMRFRTKLAAEIGIDLDKMDGFGEPHLAWETVKDNVKLLLDHSDCDGELTSGDCAKVAPRLREIVKEWADDDYDKKNALELAEGMDLCAKKSESLQFR